MKKFITALAVMGVLLTASMLGQQSGQFQNPPGGGGGGGSGTVTTVNSGNFTPLFNVSVSNQATTPTFSFTAQNAAANSWFGNATGSPAAASFNTTAFPTALIPNPAGDVINTFAATQVVSFHAGATTVPISTTAPAAGNAYGFDGTNFVPFTNMKLSQTSGSWGPWLDLCSSATGAACNDSTDDTASIMNNALIPCNTSGTCRLTIGAGTTHYIKTLGYTSSISGNLTVTNNGGACGASTCAEVTIPVTTQPPTWVTALAPVMAYAPAAFSGFTCTNSVASGTFPFYGYPWQVVSTTTNSITVATPSCTWNSTTFTPTSGNVSVGLWSDAAVDIEAATPSRQSTLTVSQGFDGANSPIVMFTSVPCLNSGPWTGITCPNGTNANNVTIHGLQWKGGTTVSNGNTAGILLYGNNGSEISRNTFGQFTETVGNQIAGAAIMLVGPVSLQGNKGFNQNNWIMFNDFASSIAITTSFQSADNWFIDNHGIGNMVGTASAPFGNFIDVCWTWNQVTGNSNCGGVTHANQNISENYSIHNIFYGQQQVDFDGKAEQTTSCSGGNCAQSVGLSIQNVITANVAFMKSITVCQPLSVINSTNVHVVSLGNNGAAGGSCNATITTDGSSYAKGSLNVDTASKPTFTLDAIDNAAGTSTYTGSVTPNLLIDTGQFSVSYPGTGITNGPVFVTDSSSNVSTAPLVNISSAAGSTATLLCLSGAGTNCSGGARVFQAGVVGGAGGNFETLFGDAFTFSSLAATGKFSKNIFSVGSNGQISSVTAWNTLASPTADAIISSRAGATPGTGFNYYAAQNGCNTTDATCGSGTDVWVVRGDGVMIMPTITTPAALPPSGTFGMYVDSSCADGFASLSHLGVLTCMGSGGGGGSPGGLTKQYQINDGGVFSADATFANSAAAGTGTVLVTQSTSDIPAFRVTGYPTSPLSDVFQVAAKGQTPGNTCSGTVNCSFWIDASNNMNFLGNTLVLGSTSQTNQSHFTLIGSASGTNTSGAILTFESNDGTQFTSLIGPGLTASGDLCSTSTFAPSTDCGYSVSGKNVIPWFVGGSGATVGHSLVIHATQPFEVEDSGVVPMGAAFPTTVSGATSGGIPYFSSTTQMSSTSLLCQFGVIQGGGSGGAPTTGNCDFTIDATAHQLSSGASGIVNFSPSTTPMKVPSISASTTSADAQVSFDNAVGAKNFHAFANSADALIVTVPVSNAVNGDCVKFSVATNNVQIVDSGASCGGGGGATALSAITAATASNTLLNGNHGAQLWEWAQTTNSQTAFEIADSAAATGTNDILFNLTTATSSTETPLSIVQGQLTSAQAQSAINVSSSWNTTGSPVLIQAAVTNTSCSGGSCLLLNLLAGASGTTSEFSVTPTGAITSAAGATINGLVGTTVGVGATTNTGATKVQCGIDNTTATSACTLTLRGSDITGTPATASLQGGSVAIRGGNNPATGATEVGGNVSINGGNCTGTATSCTSGSINLSPGTDNATSATIGAINATFAGTFNFNLTNSTSTAVANSPSLVWGGEYQNSGTPTFATDTWTVQDVVGSGTNGTSTLTFTHSGTSGTTAVSIPTLSLTNALTVANGGTGDSTLTANLPLIGNGTSAVANGFTPTSSGTITSGHLACYTASNTVGNCTGLPSNNVIGVFNSSSTWVDSGEVSVALDATVNVTFGDILCVSAGTAGTAHDNGTTSCTTGEWVGIVKTTASSVSSATAFISQR